MSEQQLREDLRTEMKDVTLATLPAFIEAALARGTGYGEICVAIGAIAAAAARAANRSPQGGITGFQASAVFWEFVDQWGVFDRGPKRMVSFYHLLYPQYDRCFAPTVSAGTWEWVQEEARKLLLDKDSGVPAVRAHWESIVDGTVPFGLLVTTE